MGKRAQRSSVCSKQQRVKHLEDRLSQLPDGILAHVLSLLKLREAGRSSVLSHRWRDLWKFTTSLNFDESETMWKMVRKPRERSKYIARVNRVLKLHLNPSLDEFRVHYLLDGNNSCDIDEWIKFLIPKRVKILEITLQLYTKGTLYTPSEECYLCFKSPSNLSSIKCLTSLSLSWVNVNGELIECFLSNCPNLEHLRLFCLSQIVNLNVSSPSLQLKHLDIFQCKSLESLEFCAPKLVTLKYFGNPMRLSIGSLPLLAELDIGGSPAHQAKFVLAPFSSYLSQIETLTLRMWLPTDYEGIPRIPELTKLKHLTLDVGVLLCSEFPCFTSLVEAAPSLLKFTFKLSSNGRAQAVLSNASTLHRLECLKDVEIFGFIDRNFVMYLLQNAINLEKITIDPCHPSDRVWNLSKVREKIRKRAHQLREEIPSRVKVIVL